MARQADSVQTDARFNTELNDDKGEDLKSLKNELSDFKRDLVSLSRNIKGMSQNQNRNSQGGGNQQRNYQNGQRGYNNQNKNFGQGNRNLNQRKPVEVGLRGRSQAGTEWPKSIKINESFANNEGLFVRAKINDKCLAFLVDTGASITILSKKFIDEINPSLLTKMNPVNINLITATGDSAPFIGQIDVEICLGNYIYHHNVLVADISNEGIIGMDFLVTHDYVLLSQKNKLKIKGEIIQCYHYASSAKSCYRVAIQETVDVHPNSEMIVSGESDEPIFRGLAVFESSQANLDKDQKEKFRDLLIEYSDIFSKSSEDIGLTDLVEHTINTGNHPPVRQRPRRIPYLDMQDIIEPSTSPWNSNIVLVKKSDGSWRFCIDFRAVNLLVLCPSYPLPRIDGTIYSLSGSKFFSTVDLKSGYYQIPVAKEDRPTAFSFPGGGLWQFKRMPMGLCNSAPVFEQLMETVLSESRRSVSSRWFDVLASYDFKIEHRAGRSHNNADALSRCPCYNKECPHCARAEINYELVPTHKNVLTVEKCNDNVTIRESCRNVQDVSVKQSVTTTSISGINEDWPNMTSDETCHKVKSHVIHNEFRSKGPDINPDVLLVQSKIVRVCTRYKDYGCSQNEKDDPVKETNFENVSESQLSDDVISIIIQWKIDEVKPIWADVSHMSPEVKFYWSKLNSLILVNGSFYSSSLFGTEGRSRTKGQRNREQCLYRKWESYNGKHYDIHIVLPANFKRFVLNQVHNIVTGGHLGVRKTLSKIKQRYFWYKMRQDVKFWCTKCDICASTKAPCKKPKARMKQYLVGAPWERMAIDILGPLPISVNNNRYLMVVQDYFSKWTEAIPIPDTEAVTVAKKFVERIQTPERLGRIYLFINVGLSVIRTSCSMLFGREVNLPVDLILGRPETEKSPLYLKTVYAYELSKKLEVIHKFARNKLKLSSDRMKRNYDVGTKMQTFDAGDPVWLHNPRRVKGLCPKLQNNWEGPYIVVNKLNDVIYRIQKGPKTKPKVKDSKKRSHRKEQDQGTKKQRTVLGKLYNEENMVFGNVREKKKMKKGEEKKRTPEEERERKKGDRRKRRRKEEKEKEDNGKTERSR
ncbi:unnamed protein product [Mytilus edulis]|uniref:Peptidase A2 domain-containing protein n=1 Tax=Mytilus edulis TaxID=6550 RepID=A0A8S3UDC6_MYTED|nr:unnamed protein product [Mytilus edulis]